MNLHTNREITSHQIADCLHVLATASNFLVKEGDFKDNSASGDHRTALEVTLTKACDRLDKILDDESRWTVPPIDGHTYVAAGVTEHIRQVAVATRLVEQRLHNESAVARAAQEEAHRHVAELIAMMVPSAPKKRTKQK